MNGAAPNRKEWLGLQGKGSKITFFQKQHNQPVNLSTLD